MWGVLDTRYNEVIPMDEEKSRRSPKVERIVPGQKDSVPRPDCYRSDGTSCHVYGPGIVEIINWPDGGVTLRIVEGCRA